MMMRIIAIRRKASVPGRNCSHKSAPAEVSVLRGSIAMSLAPSWIAVLLILNTIGRLTKELHPSRTMQRVAGVILNAGYQPMTARATLTRGPIQIGDGPA